LTSISFRWIFSAIRGEVSTDDKLVVVGGQEASMMDMSGKEQAEVRYEV
jgi:hypothetical protein